MNTLTSIITIILLGFANTIFAQAATAPDLSKVKDKNIWGLSNRKVSIDDAVHLTAQAGDGLLYLKDFTFETGTIELDIKGEDVRGRSFVGLAFHIQDDETFDAIYFRPFNFKDPNRNTHAVQYISHPEYGWRALRENHPGVYENSANPVPDPANWFHVTIKVDYPTVEVYVNDSDKASLKVKQLSNYKKGMIGFWVGNNSKGAFKNLSITTK